MLILATRVRVAGFQKIGRSNEYSAVICEALSNLPFYLHYVNEPLLFQRACVIGLRRTHAILENSNTIVSIPLFKTRLKFCAIFDPFLVKLSDESLSLI